MKFTLIGSPNIKQQLFFDSRFRYTAYGGARGGGKSWAVRRKLILMCLHYNGLKCLIIRRTYPELYNNHVLELLKQLNGLAKYNTTRKSFTFPNGSTINLGYCSAESDVLQYQGQEYDIIALDEATQLTEYQFQAFKGCLRGANPFPKRMYLTCNPGGVGHAWVKRLFIDKEFKAGENPNDYTFIQAFVKDNPALMQSDPDYVNQLESLSDDLREAWLYGRWDVFDGQFFREFKRDIHVVEPFTIPEDYRRFVALDYGFDMLAVLWIAIDYNANLIVYRELAISNLNLSQASDAIIDSSFDDKIEYISASPDLWNRRQDSGLSGAEIMYNRNRKLPRLVHADDKRIQGWRVLREYLHDAKLHIFSTCPELIRCLPALTYDNHRIEDASNEPHSITHAPEALRYAVMSRPNPPKLPDQSTDLQKYRNKILNNRR